MLHKLAITTPIEIQKKEFPEKQNFETRCKIQNPLAAIPSDSCIGQISSNFSCDSNFSATLRRVNLPRARTHGQSRGGGGGGGCASGGASKLRSMELNNVRRSAARVARSPPGGRPGLCVIPKSARAPRRPRAARRRIRLLWYAGPRFFIALGPPRPTRPTRFSAASANEIYSFFLPSFFFPPSLFSPRQFVIYWRDARLPSRIGCCLIHVVLLSVISCTKVCF